LKRAWQPAKPYLLHQFVKHCVICMKQFLLLPLLFLDDLIFFQFAFAKLIYSIEFCQYKIIWMMITTAGCLLQQNHRSYKHEMKWTIQIWKTKMMYNFTQAIAETHTTKLNDGVQRSNSNMLVALAR
jgi:hypothetical protein